MCLIFHSRILIGNCMHKMMKEKFKILRKEDNYLVLIMHVNISKYISFKKLQSIKNKMRCT